MEAAGISTSLQGDVTVTAHFFGGKHRRGSSERRAPVYNPATGDIASYVALASQSDVDAAVTAAASAFPAWAAMPPLKRARIMFRFKELIERNVDRLAATITAEHGKVLSDEKAVTQRWLGGRAQGAEFAMPTM